METKIKGKPGRKKSDVKKSLLPLFVPDALIEQMGGKKEARKKIYNILKTGAVLLLMLAMCTADSWFNY